MRFKRKYRYFISSMALMVTFLLVALILSQTFIYKPTFPDDFWLAIFFLVLAVANGIYGFKILLKKE